MNNLSGFAAPKLTACDLAQGEIMRCDKVELISVWEVN